MLNRWELDLPNENLLVAIHSPILLCSVSKRWGAVYEQSLEVNACAIIPIFFRLEAEMDFLSKNCYEEIKFDDALIGKKWKECWAFTSCKSGTPIECFAEGSKASCTVRKAKYVHCKNENESIEFSCAR